MIETSPKIPAEPIIRRVPLFSTRNSLLFLTNNASCPILPMAQCSSNNLDFAVGRRYSTEPTLFFKCSCPHVIVADDDPFQEFYYKTLFQKSLSFTHLPIKKEELRLKVFSSGEELIEAFHKYQACDCGSVMLIITDHDMGVKKLNGVETIQQLAKTKHQKPMILRTSNTLEELSKLNKDLNELLESKVITQFLHKADHEKTRKTIESILGSRKG